MLCHCCGQVPNFCANKSARYISAESPCVLIKWVLISVFGCWKQMYIIHSRCSVNRWFKYVQICHMFKLKVYFCVLHDFLLLILTPVMLISLILAKPSYVAEILPFEASLKGHKGYSRTGICTSIRIQDRAAWRSWLSIDMCYQTLQRFLAFFFGGVGSLLTQIKLFKKDS